MSYVMVCYVLCCITLDYTILVGGVADVDRPLDVHLRALRVVDQDAVTLDGLGGDGHDGRLPRADGHLVGHRVDLVSVNHVILYNMIHYNII